MHGGHLGHVTSITNFHFHEPKSVHTEFGPVVSEKSCFNFHILMALGQGQGQEMTLTFNTNIPS